jgi:hypothetical protein
MGSQLAVFLGRRLQLVMMKFATLESKRLLKHIIQHNLPKHCLVFPTLYEEDVISLPAPTIHTTHPDMQSFH